MARSLSPLAPFVDKVEGVEALDGVAKPLAKEVRGLVQQPLKDVLSGTWLGHALHPPLTDVVIGSFLSATLLDLLGGDDDGTATERLIGVGLAAAVPTVLTGVTDWADSEPVSDGVRRVGIVHAAANVTSFSLYAASLAARRRGARGRGKALAAAGAGFLSLAGHLGGHLSFSRGIGPDQTVYDPGPTDWTPAVDTSQLADDRPTRVVVDETPVLVVKQGERFYAIHDRCSHRGCSLADGELEGRHIVCMCHGSTFDLADGAVERGPATAPQPAFQTRVQDGRLEVRLL